MDTFIILLCVIAVASLIFAVGYIDAKSKREWQSLWKRYHLDRIKEAREQVRHCQENADIAKYSAQITKED